MRVKTVLPYLDYPIGSVLIVEDRTATAYIHRGVFEEFKSKGVMKTSENAEVSSDNRKKVGAYKPKKKSKSKYKK